jgi:glycosyltransferase involved in cell wall biosynthesis
VTAISARTARPLRVALIVPGLLVGGCERHVVKLAIALRRRGAEPCVIVLQGRLALPLASALPPDVPLSVGPYHRRDPRLVRWLATQLHRQRVDVAQSFLWYGDAVSAVACTLFSAVPLICSERGDRGSPYYTTMRLLIDRLLTFRTARRICANSAYGAGLLVRLGCDARKVRVISNGIDLGDIDREARPGFRSELGLPSSAPLIVVVSRLAWYKGVDVAIRGFAALGSGCEAHLIVVGDGAERASLEALARESGVAGRVHFVGTRSDPEVFVREATVTALTTRTAEHCSNSILEYMACGKPVVATRVGGNAELVTDGETGVIVAVDDVDAVRDAFQRLLVAGPDVARMGAAGRRWIETHATMELVADRFLALCLETIGVPVPRADDTAAVEIPCAS